MVAGLLLRWVFRAPLRLLFTSAAQREHQPFTKWLIRNMDAVIATSARSGAFLDVPHTVVMHGVDLDRFHPPATATDRLCRFRPARALSRSAASAGSATRRARTSSSMR